MAGYSTVEKLPPQHQVFINFRGTGLRKGFVSHLVDALKRKKINAFYDGDEDRGECLEKLLKRIEESRITVAILSTGYNESVWCLRELAKMKECMDEGKLVTIPIFFKVSTSSVADMSGHLDMAIEGLKEEDDATTKKKEWEEALKWIPTLTGFRVKEDSNESKKVQKIVEEVYKWLNKIPLKGSQKTSVLPLENSYTRTSLEGQKDATFGINQRVKELIDKLDLTDKKTRIIGVVGMPGIGKTTLLKELFKSCEHKFPRRALIDQVHEISKSSDEFDILPKLLVQKLLAFNESTLDNVEDPYEMYKVPLQHDEVLVILDDVSKSEQINALLGRLDWIKEGSRIVIATNDMSLLKDPVQDDPYVVQKLNHQDGLNLFSYHAFDQDNPPEDFMKLSEEFVHYAKGHPLALKILGRELCGKKKEFWDSQLMNLAQSPSPYFGSIFQASYDELTPGHKEAFLDIACFRSQDVDYVENLLDSSEAVKVLANKFLINICDGRVEMHDLLYTFSRDLDPKASSQGGSKGRRLWHRQDIIKEGKINVLQNKLRAADVRGIFLDLSEVKETSIHKDHFNCMTNLRYLRFYNSRCPQECKTDNKIKLPGGLKLPLKKVRCLHWLKFPLEELPNNFDPITLVDLKLPYSEIKQLWEGDKDTPVLRWVDLNHSSKLNSLTGLSKAKNLQGLNLEGCTSLKSLQGVDSKSLKTLTLSGCSNFKEFPLIPENLEALYLDGTAISQLPDNVVNLERLVLLNMKDCKMLENIPTCVGELKALKKLILSGCLKLCLKLKDFPENNKSSLKILLLDGTSIKRMPQLPSVQYLCLSRNYQISYLPEGINQLSQLTWLDLKYCTSLTSVPELPPNLQYFDAHGCNSLKTVAKPLARILPTVQNHCTFNFTNCGSLEQDAKEEITSYAQRKCQLLSYARKHYNKGLSSESLFSTCFPGSEVPSWFCHDGVGSLLKLRLPPHWHEKSLSGIALCAAVSFPCGKDKINGFSVACTFTITANEKSWIPFTCPVGSWTREGNKNDNIESDHIFIGYISCPHTIRCLEDGNSDECDFTEASIEFTVTGGTSKIGKVLRCGLSLVYEKDKNKHSSHEATYDMPVEVSCQEPQDGVVEEQQKIEKQEVMLDDQRISENAEELIISDITPTCGANVTPRMEDKLGGQANG